MKASDRKILKKKIIDELENLTHDIIELKELVKPIAPENAIGRISRMDAINNKSVNEAALRKATIRLADLKDAIISIEEESFGICLNCRKEIPMGRLLLRPQSKSCVECAH